MTNGRAALVRTRTSRIPLLFLVADTGGGHRAAGKAVAEALEAAYPRAFAPLWCDPLTGPRAAPLLRWVSGLYGPVVRRAPWAWGAAWHLSNRRPVAALLHRTLFALADRPVTDAVAAHRPAVIVSFHPLTGQAAVTARRAAGTGAPVVSVVTDLVTAHASWRRGGPDRVVVPTAAAFRRFDREARAGRCVDAGLPVTAAFAGSPPPGAGRAALRRSLGIPASQFVVLVAGGGEGCGHISKSAAAIIRYLPGIHVVAVCGRNRRARRTLTGLAADAGGLLTVTGFVSNLADWLRCADLVVTKAGPGMIAEAACCGTPMLLTSHLPGQERGNIEFAVAAGAARPARGARDLVRETGRLHRDPEALKAMRAGCAALARRAAATETAELIARLAGAGTGTGARYGEAMYGGGRLPVPAGRGRSR